MNKTNKAAAWTKLKTFTVALVSVPPPSRPGKVEVRVRVALTAANASGDTVTIPDDELKALLTIVNYDDGLSLPGWSIEYDTKTASSTGVTQQSIDFWITGTNPCAPLAHAAASILPPGASAPIQTRPGSSEGSFDSSVELPTLSNPLWEITTFELERISASDMVYVNGLQQIKLKAELAFTDLTTGNPGKPTAEELASLTVAFKDGGLALPADNGSTPGWVTSPGVASSSDTTYDKGYLPYPGSNRPATADHSSPRASTFAYFYVTCRGGPIQKETLCAYVKCRDGWVYRTNGTNTDPCGNEYSGNSDSTVAVQGMAKEVGDIDRYPWVRDVLSGDDDGIDRSVESAEEVDPDVINPDSVHRYSLSFKDKFDNEVGIRSLTVEPAGMIQWHDKVAGEHRACYTGYAAPNSTDLQWNPNVPTGSLPKPYLPSVDERKGVVVLVGRQDIAFASGKPAGPCKLSTTDWYGNTNTLSVRFESTIGDGRWKLVLTR